MAREFKYLGSVVFEIDRVAAGHRFIFVNAGKGKRIRKMFVIQQEGFLPSSSDTYKYRISDPVNLGSAQYQHSVILYDNDATIRDEPGKEADVTKSFLALHGYKLNAELGMSRFARPADDARKHEIILFCFEDLSSYGHQLRDFPENSASAEEQRIKHEVDENCRRSFRLADSE